MSKLLFRRSRHLLLLSFLLPTACFVNEGQFRRLIDRMREDVLELRSEVERLYSNRCDPATLQDCQRNVHSTCVSTITTGTCHGGIVMSNPICGQNQEGSSSCGTLYDYEHSAVFLPGSLQTGTDRNPTDPKVIESICYTQDLDNYFVDKFESSREFWSEFGVEPAWLQFGAQ